MPNATALTLAAFDQTTRYLPVSSTRPVRSSTPFGSISVSYSIHSSAVGVATDAIATLQVTAELLLLQIDIVATVNVVDGTV